MAFTVSLTDVITTAIASNDRGEWKRVENDGSAPETYTGFGGENYVTIHMSWMQNFSCHLLVVSNCVDNPIETFTSMVKHGMDDSIVEAEINRLIGLACDYPLVLTLR